MARNTVQRKLVLDAVRGMRCHPTADELYREIAREHPSVSKATVYRNLNQLAGEKEILRIKIPDSADRYDFTTKRHYHARCRVCGRVVDVDMPDRFDFAGQALDAHGFFIEGHDLVFSGVCQDCVRDG